jgi:hypothetical protein
MSDEDNGGAASCKPPYRLEEPVGFGIGKHGGRLIQNQNLRAADEDLDDLDLLLFRDRQIIYAAIGIKDEPQFRRLALYRVPDFFDADR